VRRLAVPASLYAGSHATELWFLQEMGSDQPGNKMDATIISESDYFNRVVWCGWQWRPPRSDRGEKAGTLLMARSSTSRREVERVLGDGRTAKLYQHVQPRDAGEDINGDGGLTPSNLAPVSSQVTEMTWGWVDFSGGTLTMSADDGVTATNASGGGIAPTGDPWWTSDVRIVDGLYRDGRSLTADLGRDVQSWRPAMLRVRFTLRHGKSGLERTYSFSFPLGLDTPKQSGL
jgi:hypothetical protein